MLEGDAVDTLLMLEVKIEVTCTNNKYYVAKSTENVWSNILSSNNPGPTQIKRGVAELLRSVVYF